VRTPISENLREETNLCIVNLAAVHTGPGHPANEYSETNIPGARNFSSEKHGPLHVMVADVSPGIVELVKVI
jgi:hypothetical protein